jgi:Regulator of chromosome condensation (RCC1) repeat
MSTISESSQSSFPALRSSVCADRERAPGERGAHRRRRGERAVYCGITAQKRTAEQITTGVAHVCALLSEGRVRCWGRGADGALGYGNGLDIGDDETPDSAGDVPVGGRVVQIAAGGFHTCALLDTGKVRCWGDSQYGQLGYSSIQRVGDTETPAQVGDVKVFLSDPATPPPKPWTSQAPPGKLPLLWERRSQVPKAEQCPESCQDCKLVFDGARSLHAARQAKPRRLSARERALFGTAYRQYLESSICLGYDHAPEMEFRAIGSAQDPARVHAVLDAAFTAPGRAQTLIVATVDICGGDAARFVWGRSLAILLEKDELVSISLLFGWDRAWARDLNGDGISELVGLMRSSVFTSDFGDLTVLQVARYAGGQWHPLASVDADTMAAGTARTTAAGRFGPRAAKRMGHSAFARDNPYSPVRSPRASWPRPRRTCTGHFLAVGRWCVPAWPDRR